MEPISNVDRLVLILRQQLQERARASAGARRSSEPLTGPASLTGVDFRAIGCWR